MRIGIVCYASVGGSGVVATELAHALALRGHQVQLVSSEVPFRWRAGLPGLSFQRVDTPAYPLFREPQYLLALANRLVQVSRAHRLDIIHAHYAIPHAAAAYLARQILAGAGGAVPRVITTLHGTDVTILGADPSYRETVAFCIDQSDAVTTVSRSLRADTVARLGIARDIHVIPNFLDCDAYRRHADPDLRERLTGAGPGDAVIVHMSNFRPVKRVEVVMEAFRRIRRVLCFGPSCSGPSQFRLSQFRPSRRRAFRSSAVVFSGPCVLWSLCSLVLVFSGPRVCRPSCCLTCVLWPSVR